MFRSGGVGEDETRNSLKLELYTVHGGGVWGREWEVEKKIAKLKNKRQLGNFVVGQHSKPKINKYKKFPST